MKIPHDRPIFFRAVKALVMITLFDSFMMSPHSELVYSTNTWTNGQSRRFGPGSR